MSLGNGSVSEVIAVNAGTDAVFTVSYPQVTVRKVVLGTEPTAGFAYPMAISCATATPSVLHGTTTAVGGLPNDGDLVVTGAGSFVEISVPNLNAAGLTRFYDYRTTALPAGAPPGSAIHNRAAWLASASRTP